MNRVLLQAQVVERAAVRYTPAGLPAVDVRLAHASQVEHAGQMRQVSCEIHATAVDGVATQLNRIAVGQTVDVVGFLGKQRNGRGVMLHIIELTPHPASTD